MRLSATTQLDLASKIKQRIFFLNFQMEMPILRLLSLILVVLVFQFYIHSVWILNILKYYTYFLTSTLGESLEKDGGTPKTYDFIVVGVGSAGSILVNRLSEKYKVLGIEAGGTPFPANSVPILASQLWSHPSCSFKYETVKQDKACGSSSGKISHWFGGKMLGGSSNVNAMMYVRGRPQDYDHWATLVGDASWNYTNLLAYFGKGVNYNGEFDEDAGFYGDPQKMGLHVEKNRNLRPLHDVLMKAGVEVGLETNVNLNGWMQGSGMGPMEVYQKNGARQSGYTAFIEPILSRKNLHLALYSTAIKLELEGVQNRVGGVWYKQQGKLKFARASKEVIVSAGAIGTPKLLMLSGIGDSRDLRTAKIDPKVDLPRVGKNLKDHLMTLVMPIAINSTLSFVPERDLGARNILDYFWYGTGPFTAPGGNPSQVFFSSKYSTNTRNPPLAKGKDDWPDLQLMISNVGYLENFSDVSNFKPELFRTLYDGVPNMVDGIIVSVVLGRPESVGNLTITSSDPDESPVISPNYLAEESDLKRLVSGIKFVLRLVEETEAFQRINATYTRAPIEECRNHRFRSDAYWECYVRHVSHTVYHPVGTCGMGKDVNGGVVDSHLRVFHVPGLRIADASVMPEIVNGNTHATVAMIGEKAADMILKSWPGSGSSCPASQMRGATTESQDVGAC